MQIWLSKCHAHSPIAEVIFRYRFRLAIVPLPQGPLWDEIRPLHAHGRNLPNTDLK